jgi:hypothetical protein
LQYIMLHWSSAVSLPLAVVTEVVECSVLLVLQQISHIALKFTVGLQITTRTPTVKYLKHRINVPVQNIFETR